MEIITGVERRRRWRLEEKLRIVAETAQPGAKIADIARQYELSRGLLWNWRSQVRRGVLKQPATPAFVPIRVVGGPTASEPISDPRVFRPRPDHAAADSKIEVRLTDGTVILIAGDVSLTTLRRVMAAVRR